MSIPIVQIPREPALTPEPAAARRRALSREECIAVLREIGWGVLAVAERGSSEAVPIGVPTAYAHDGENLYVAMVEGRKRRALELNPHVCLTVADVRSLRQWRSVMVIGVPRWLTSDTERARAVAAFTVQPRAPGHELSPRDAVQLGASELMRLEVRELRGFEATLNDCAGVSPKRGSAAWASAPVVQQLGGPAVPRDDAPAAMDAIRRIIRALRDATHQTEASLGVSAAQLFVLREIEKAGTPTIGELARRTATAQSSVSEVVARLATRGLVSRGRSSEDRRRASIALTAAGRDALAQAPESLPERLLAGFRSLPRERQRDLADGLVDWIEAAGLAHHAATMFFEPLLEDA
ncbi:MAG TPA: pyridoxamine 5'-phosphate oxidase family protein [Gemmatimonadaceae bacterium]|nr:pyridoxamine 5'-phosphate oxidase family protein [Gemmatimonadaceae bacterium]